MEEYFYMSWEGGKNPQPRTSVTLIDYQPQITITPKWLSPPNDYHPGSGSALSGSEISCVRCIRLIAQNTCQLRKWKWMNTCHLRNQPCVMTVNNHGREKIASSPGCLLLWVLEVVQMIHNGFMVGFMIIWWHEKKCVCSYPRACWGLGRSQSTLQRMRWGISRNTDGATDPGTWGHQGTESK